MSPDIYGWNADPNLFKSVVYGDSMFKDSSRVYLISELLPFHDLRPYGAMDGWHWQRDVKTNLAFADGHAKTMPVDRALNNQGNPTAYVYDYHWPRRAFPAGDWWTTAGTEGLMDLDP